MRLASVADGVMRSVMVRPERCNSWLCPVCSQRLGKVLQQRLRRRLEGERVLMLTLTLDRCRFDSPIEAYEFVCRNRSVSRAMGAFCEKFGIKKWGQYFWKMELQGTGWCHWHVLLVVPPVIDIPLRDAASDCWTLGYSNVRECHSVSYIAKYAAKPGECGLDSVASANLPARGVRFTGASRGFWNSPRKVRAEPFPSRGGGTVDVAFDTELYEEANKNHVLRVECCGASTRVSVLSMQKVMGEWTQVFDGGVVVPFPIADVMHAAECVTGCYFEDGDVVVTEPEWQALLDHLGFEEEEYEENGRVRVYLRRIGGEPEGYEGSG